MVGRKYGAVVQLGSAIRWLAALPSDLLGPNGRMRPRPGLADIARLAHDHDVLIYYPAIYETGRDEAWGSGAVYLALLSAVTGIEIDPKVRRHHTAPFSKRAGR